MLAKAFPAMDGKVINLLMAGETPVTEAATNLGNRKKYHLVSLGEAEQH